jgi:hypothetical protein
VLSKSLRGLRTHGRGGGTSGCMLRFLRKLQLQRMHSEADASCQNCHVAF